MPLCVLAQENADKDKDIFYKLGGGLRMRQFFMQNSTTGYQPFTEDFVNTSHRAQLDFQLNKGEYFETFFRAIHHSIWGQATTASNTSNDQFTVQQAYANWKVTDFLNLKFGRQSIQLGRGLVFGANEWENVPTFYDGFATLFDWEAMELGIYGVKVYELERVNGVSIAGDPELTNYIMDLKFKDLPDIIQLADINFVQVLGDVGQVPNSSVILRKQRVQRFGLDLIASSVYFEAGATLNYVTGTKEGITITDKVKQLMIDGEMKLKLPDWNQFQLWVGLHSDSGDDDPNDGTDAQYEPLNYNYHLNAGRADFFKFGNLTFARAGSTFQLLSDWYFGAEFFLFQKTKSNGKNYLEHSIMAADFASDAVQFGFDKSLATEVDLWMGKKFASGVNLELSVGYIQPGQAMKTSYLGGVSSNVKALDSSLLNVIIDVGFFF